MGSKLAFGMLLAIGCGTSSTPDAGLDASEADAGHPECLDRYSGEPGRYFAWSGENGDVGYELWRCELVPPIGGEPEYRVDRFVLRLPATTYTADPATIEYTSSHHGWNDSLVAPTPQAIMRWRSSYDGSATRERYFVSADAPSGGVLLAETEMPWPW